MICVSPYPTPRPPSHKNFGFRDTEVTSWEPASNWELGKGKLRSQGPLLLVPFRVGEDPGNKGHGERDFERARSAKRARGGGKNYYKSQISRRDMENSLFQQPLGLESHNAPRTSLFRQSLCAREELAQGSKYGFLENFQNQKPITQLAQTYSVCFPEILLMFTLFLLFLYLLLRTSH